MYLMCAIEVAKQEDEGGKEKRYSLHKYKYYDIDVFVLLFLECYFRFYNCDTYKDHAD